jgi:hypothetical protein
MNFNVAGPKAFNFNKLLCENNKGESKFTSTCEKIQNQFTSIFLITYFEFEWLFVNEIETLYILHYQCPIKSW